MSDRKVYIKTYGCQMNKYDSSLVKKFFQEEGFEIVNSYEDADIILANTCSVRDHAEERAIGWVNFVSGIKKENPGVKIGVFGCMAQRYGEKLKEEIPRIDFIVGPNNLKKIPELVKNHTGELKVDDDQREFTTEGCNSYLQGNELSTFVSISRGCDNYCSYCIVPYVRGSERCRDSEDIVDEIRTYVEKGIKEITLLGQNVNSYEDEGVNFPKLLEMINEIPGLQRIRFATSHPKNFSETIIDKIASLSKVCEEIHLPVQAGSNKILEKMNRDYTREKYLSLITKIRKRMPNAAITTDILVGFPGETIEDYKQTYELFDEVQFAGAFMFKYSPRPNTAASNLEDDVPDDEKVSRLEKIIDLNQKYAEEYSKQQIGRDLKVLIVSESDKNPGKFLAKARNGRNVIVPKDGNSIGEIKEVKIKRASTWTLFV